MWGISVGIAMLVVAVISPILGVIADYTGQKKRMLIYFTVLAVTATGTLYFVQKGDVLLGMVLFILAEIGYRGGQVFYNSLLPEVADRDEIGRVLGNGWAIGLLGGIVCLLIVLVLVTVYEGTWIFRFSLVITAVYFVAFAVAGRTSSFVGPTIFGIVAAEAALFFEAQGNQASFLWFRFLPGGAPFAEQLRQQVAILPVILFLLVGLVLLLRVNEKDARNQFIEPTS